MPDLTTPQWQMVFGENFDTLDRDLWHVHEDGWATDEAMSTSGGEPTLRTFTRNGRHHRQAEEMDRAAW